MRDLASIKTLTAKDLPVGKSAPLATAVFTPSRKVSKFGGQSQSIAFPPNPAHLSVPSFSLIPAVTPKGGINEGSTPPDDEEDDEEEDEEDEEEAGGGEFGVPTFVDMVAGADDATVMKVFGAPAPKLPPGFPP